MRKIIRKALLFTTIFSLMLMGGVVLVEAEDVDENLEAKERVDLLLEKTEELLDLITEMKQSGDTSVVVSDKTEEGDCDLYLNEYITYGIDNNPKEVEKLQVFLNDHMELDIPVTGFYGETTMSAVNDFQVKYTKEVLSPWGTTNPTGQVYKTTQRMINNIMCPDVVIAVPDVSVDLERIEEEKKEDEVEETVFLEDTFFPLDENDEEDDEDEEEENDLITGLFNSGDGKTNYLPILIIIMGLVGIAAILYYLYSPKKQKKGNLIP